MAAGAGYIEFATGDILTASAANQYLASQVVMVFASASARTSAIASPQEGMISYLKDTNSVEYYSGSAWVAVGGSSGGGGLELITAQTFSAASAVNLNSCFSSTYETYEIVLNGTTSANAAIYAQMRQGTTNITTASYENRNPGSIGPASSWQLTFAGGVSVWAVDMSIYSPTTTGYPAMTSTHVCLYSGVGAAGGANGGFYDGSVSGGYDGLSLFPNTGTMTGSVRVYGRKKVA